MSLRVSALVATYNGERFLGETLESILAQRLPPVEILVCDDGSTDSTRELIERAGPRVRLLTQENQGVSSARNRAAAEASGDFLAFLDQDDLWDPDLLQNLAPRLEANPEWALVYSDSRIIDAEAEVHGRRGEFLHYREGRVFQHLLGGNFIPLETTVLRAEVFKELGGFRSQFRLLEDLDLCLRASRIRPIGFCPQVLASYRIHDRNLSYQRLAMEEEWVRILEELAASRALFSEGVEAKIRSELARRCGELAWKLLRRGEIAAADPWIEGCGKGGPPGLRGRLRVVRTLLGLLPAPLRRGLLDLVPEPRLYGLRPLKPPPLKE